MLRFLNSIASAIEWAIIAWALLMVTALLDPASADEDTGQFIFPARAMACNCVAYSIEALSRVHIRLKTIPAIGENDWYKHAGSYSRGVVNIADIDNCRVMLHEFVHHWQWLQHGDAQDIHEWQRREMQAAMITMLAESEMEGCK